MTESEAIKELQQYVDLPFEMDVLEEAAKMAIHALKKQMPKKIVYHKLPYGTPYRCLECEADQIAIDFFNSDGTEPNEKYSWCWHCGQKLDWGDAE